MNGVLFSEEKVKILKEANSKLSISNLKDRGIIFIYCPPKVGSTSLVSYIRIFASKIFTVIHLHDELMLKVLTRITDVTINEIIQYNAQIGRNVYVIDVYRSPMERKMSTYFEELSCVHFNNTEENIDKYNVEKIIKRFNQILPHIANGDHLMDKYNIKELIPEKFDFVNKHLLIKDKESNINYLKLRLKDSEEWGEILSKVFNTQIIIKNDYETKNKSLGSLFEKFKLVYKMPVSYLSTLKECPYLSYYYSETEREEYLSNWRKKMVSLENVNVENVNVENVNVENDLQKAMTKEEYDFYIKLCIDNISPSLLNSSIKKGSLQYKDEGCICADCILLRTRVRRDLLLRELKELKEVYNVDSVVCHGNVNVNSNNKNVLKLNSNWFRLF
jgi:hypothetical protein